MARVIPAAALLGLLMLAATRLSAVAEPPRLEAAAGDATYGGELYSAWCSNCHGAAGAADAFAPTLSGLFGRRAGSVEAFAYSSMITQLDFVWSAEALDAWLQGLATESPTTSIRHLGVGNAGDRAAIVAYVGSLK